jgi:hypothetical protein
MRIGLALSLVLAFCAVILAGCGGSAGSLLGLPGVTPTITSLSPASVAPGGTFTVNGTNLNGVYTTAYFFQNGNQVASVTASGGSSSSVTVVVPSSLFAGTYTVDVITTDSNADPGSASAQSNGVTLGIT